ncbi:MAG TPA: hypothetical protein VHT75_18120, partial [Acidimicrobiales bacterium]|nr:hypothetical protein [Acidimicrobiales bacterium]
MSEIDTDADADAEPRTGAPAGPGRLVGRFPLSWDPVVGRAARLFGVTPDCAWVDINDGRLTARFGPWVTATDLANVASAEITGPYRWWKVAGPAHLSLRDLGLTYATTAAAGVCIRFRDPVRGIDPIGAIRHPSLTVTVADPEGLCDALGHVSTHVDAQRFDPTESVRQRLTQGAV